LTEILVENNKISMPGQLMSAFAYSVKQCLSHETTIGITEHCNISFLKDREVSYNNKKKCLTVTLHQGMLCRPTNIQNSVGNQNLGIRSIHNLSTTDLFGNGDKAQNIAKLSRMETDSTSHQEGNNLKLEVMATKGSHHSRKRQGPSEGFKDEDSKISNGHFEGKKSEDITSKGMHCVMLNYLCILGMHVKFPTERACDF